MSPWKRKRTSVTVLTGIRKCCLENCDRQSSREGLSFLHPPNGDCGLPIGPRREKTCRRGLANNKGADQPAHPRSLISTFVIGLLESTISKLATSEISIFKLVFVAWETSLSLAFVRNPEDRFCGVEAQFIFP